jgi:hypothetical protein
MVQPVKYQVALVRMLLPMVTAFQKWGRIHFPREMYLVHFYAQSASLRHAVYRSANAQTSD